MALTINAILVLVTMVFLAISQIVLTYLPKDDEDKKKTFQKVASGFSIISYLLLLVVVVREFYKVDVTRRM